MLFGDGPGSGRPAHRNLNYSEYFDEAKQISTAIWRHVGLSDNPLVAYETFAQGSLGNLRLVGHPLVACIPSFLLLSPS